MTDVPPIARPNYFTGEALLTDDFVCEQRYHMEMLQALNLGLHTYGIASGLDVYWQAGVQSRQVRVGSGMAIDRLGREIVMTQPRVISLGDAAPGSMHFLTIRYHDTFAELSDDGGVLGYKRILQEPVIEYAATLQDPGLNVLLAVVNMSSQGVINQLTYEAGGYERRYVGGRFGALSLVTEGSGILAASDPGNAMSVGATLAARREASGDGAYLEVGAARTLFDGMVAGMGAVGIGTEYPTADLDLGAIMTDGLGTITSNGVQMTLTRAITPPLQPGDMVMPLVPPGATPIRPRWAVVAAATSDPLVYTLVTAFDPPLTLPYRFGYARGTVARVSSPVGDPTSRPLDLLRVERTGQVGLGLRASPASGGVDGPSALTIQPDRRVGIGLTADPVTQAQLEVGGLIHADALSVAGAMESGGLTVKGGIYAEGAVQAASFEGNGSKLKNLPILSYWTKVNPTASVSPIYFDGGAVGIQTAAPLASLTVGSGRAFVGSGLVSRSVDNSLVLIGNQTCFLSEVNVGDSIQVGALRLLRQMVAKVVSDTELELTEQFPVILQAAQFQVTGADGKANKGDGQVSSNGTRLLGKGTKFTQQVKSGTEICIQDFIPNGDKAVSTWRVAMVSGDTQLVLMQRPDQAQFPANLSAFMVQPSLMTMIQDNSETPANTPPSGDAPVPALLAISNGAAAAGQAVDGSVPANTVAINTPLSKVDSSYALQVTGAVDFSGTIVVDSLQTGTLTVTKTATIGQTLSVQGDTQIGGTITGEQGLTLTGDIQAQNAALKGGLTVQGNLSCQGGISAAGNLSGSQVGCGALSAGPLTVSPDGSISVFGAPFLVPQSFKASTDGILVVQAVPRNDDSIGVVRCESGSFNYVMSVLAFNQSSGFKVKSYRLPNTMTVPVRRNDSVKVVADVASGGIEVTCFFTPLGAASGMQTLSNVAPPPDLAALTSPGQQIRHAVAVSGDLANVLADAANMSAGDALRDQLTQDITKLTCAASPDGVTPDVLGAVVDTVTAMAHVKVTDAQRKALEDSIRAVLPGSGGPDGVQALAGALQAIGIPRDPSGRRLMMRALERVIGLPDAD